MGERTIPQVATGSGRLLGRSALVVGGTSGIGLAIVRDLLAASAGVAAIGRTSTEVESLRVALGRNPGSPVAANVPIFAADIRDRAALEAIREELLAMGFRPDSIIANAGMVTREAALEMPDESLRATFDTNLYGTFVTLQTFAPPVLIRPGGRFVVTSSVVAVHATPGRSAYTTSKAGLIGLVRSLAIEWGPYGATVNAIAPGLISTPLTREYLARYPERGQFVVGNTPLGRLGEPEDIAPVVTFLLTDDARFITGQTLVVDGGFSAGSSSW